MKFAMQVTETTNEGLKRAYKVVVPAADIEEKLTARLDEIAKSARMPGFRPGKVPAGLLKKTHGNAVMGEVLEQTVNESSQSAMKNHELRPVTQPKIEIDKFEDGEDLEYSIELEVFPEITLTDFSKLKLERFKVPADEEQVDATLEQMAASQKETKPVEDARPAKSGDVAVIDFVGRVGGEEFAGGKADGYSLDLGSGSFVPGFEEQVIGHSVGETFDVNVTFPENYAEELASKDAIFEVTVREIREGVPVELNDEIAKKMGLENLDELKKSIRDSHEQEMGVFTRMRTKRDLLDILDKEHQFELPEGMMDAEFNAIWDQFQKQKENNPDQIDEDDKNKSEDELKAQYRGIAERRVRLGLLLAEIGRVNEITVTPDELNRALMQEAQRHQGQEKEVFEYYKNNPEAMQALQSPVLEDKVVDFIIELADVEEKEVTIEELMQKSDADELSDANQDKPRKKKAAKKKATAKSKAKKDAD